MTYPNLQIELSSGSLLIQLPPEIVREMQATLATIVDRLKATTQTAHDRGQHPRQETVEYRYVGSVALEIFCNPNIWSSPHAAQVLVSVRNEGIRVTSEVSLPQLLDCIEQYLVQVAR